MLLKYVTYKREKLRQTDVTFHSKLNPNPKPNPKLNPKFNPNPN
jgi:hypothetical protein